VSHSAEIVAWTCFVVGILLLLAGVVIGLALTFRKATKQVEHKMRQVRAKVDELTETAVSGSLHSHADHEAAATAEAAGADVKSAPDDAADLVEGALDVGAGLLVLVGAALMSVATVQFGGHAIF